MVCCLICFPTLLWQTCRTKENAEHTCGLGHEALLVCQAYEEPENQRGFQTLISPAHISVE